MLDFAWLQRPRTDPWSYVLKLPSLAAGGLERAGKTIDPASLAPAESYATGAYFADLLKGPGDGEAVGRMSDEMAKLTGLDRDFLRRQAARPAINGVQREAERGSGRVSSAYDTGITGWDPEPDALHGGFEDPQLSAIHAPLTSAMIDLYGRTLKWPVPNQRYELLNGAVNRGWTWGSGRQAPEAMSALKGALSLDGKLRVMVAPRLHRSCDALLRLQAADRAGSALRRRPPRPQGLSGRAHVLLPRRLARGLPPGCGGPVRSRPQGPGGDARPVRRPAGGSARGARRGLLYGSARSRSSVGPFA